RAFQRRLPWPACWKAPASTAQEFAVRRHPGPFADTRRAGNAWRGVRGHACTCATTAASEQRISRPPGYLPAISVAAARWATAVSVDNGGRQLARAEGVAD